MGGTTILIYVCLALFAPSLLAVITPIITAAINALSALGTYLWKAFLYISQSVPAMILIVFVSVGAYQFGQYKGTQKTWVKAHDVYTLTPKPKVKEDSSTYNIFMHPLEIFR